MPWQGCFDNGDGIGTEGIVCWLYLFYLLAFGVRQLLQGYHKGLTRVLFILILCKAVPAGATIVSPVPAAHHLVALPARLFLPRVLAAAHHLAALPAQRPPIAAHFGPLERRRPNPARVPAVPQLHGQGA